MSDENLTDQLRAITDRFYVKKPVGLLGGFEVPFDVTKPNLHDNKQDFLSESSAVSKAIENAEGLLDALLSPYRDGPLSTELAERLMSYVDSSARADGRSKVVDAGYDLVRRNASEVGLTTCLAFQLIDLVSALSARKKELEDQEAEFWSGKSRPPNHYARTIALRFARFIAHNTHTRPTFGTSRDGSHPSTDFGRALEEIFQLLGIKANVRNAASWAVKQISDEDIEPPPKNALNALFAYGENAKKSATQGIDELVSLMEKGTDK